MEPDNMESKISLPNELLLKIIIKFVPMCQWSSSLEYVSKQFQSCVHVAFGQLKSIDLAKLFSSSLAIKNWEAVVPQAVHCENLEPRSKLLFWEESAVLSARLNNILMKLLWVCPDLTEISGFEYIVRSVDFETWNILMEFENLHTITLAGLRDKIAFEYFVDFVKNSKTLKTLNIYSCYFDVEDRILDIGTLSSVTIIEWCTKKTTLIENVSEKLTSLKLHSFGCAFKTADDATKALKTCTNLESLSIGICNILEHEIFLNELPNLCKLTKLRLSGHSSSVPYGKRFCVQLKSLKKQLKSIDFSGIELDDVVLEFLLTKCKNLHSLKFDGFSSLTTTALKNVPSLPAGLKKLTFSTSRQRIAPILLPKLAQLSNFTTLNINSYGVETVGAKLEDIACLNNLQNLRLHGAWVTDTLLKKWDRKNDGMLGKLISLYIPNCTHITDVGGSLLAKKAVNLQCLDLCMSRITEKTIFELDEKAKKLTNANLGQRKPFLFDENDILAFIKKAVCLKILHLETELAKKVVEHKDFQPFLESVEILV